MKKKLKEVAEVLPGSTVRKPPKGAEVTSCPVVQIKNIKNNGVVDMEDASSAQFVKLNREQRLRPGDLLFCSRGARNKAGLFTFEDLDAVAGSQLYIIRPKDEFVLSSYLAWFINQPPGQAYFKQHQAGSYIVMVRRSVVQDMPIILPPLDVQKRIVEIWNLEKKEQELLESLKVQRELCLFKQCENMLENYK